MVGVLDGLLGVILHEVGFDEEWAMSWGMSGRLDSLGADLPLFFNGVAGKRLRRCVFDSIGTRWRWRHARRSHLEGNAGWADIPVNRLWMSLCSNAVEPIKPECLEGFTVDQTFGLGNDGLIAIDVSDVSGMDTDPAHVAIAGRALVERVMLHPDLWSVLRLSECDFTIRLSGALNELIGPDRQLGIIWDVKQQFKPQNARVRPGMSG